MVLTVLSAMLLTLGAPVSLAVRALPRCGLAPAPVRIVELVLPGPLHAF